ncbi:MAG: glycosyltransferase family 9 protein [Bdellovibrionales bacterium]|jgi:ADP-heptose:LPS heptosyltransferase|nr:glycosyltransferase family 9 protein [Bdellovibrionales bacterium]
MKILFISATNLGDAIITTGALDYLLRQHPDAQVTVACGPLVTSIFSAIPNVVHVVPMKKERFAGHWRMLARSTALNKWDIVVDMRNSPLSRVLHAKKRYIWNRQSKSLHKVEQVGNVIGVSPPPAPRIWLDDKSRATAQRFIPDGLNVLAIAPAARWIGKTWPGENFAELAKKLTDTDGPLSGAHIAVFGAPGEESIARPVLAALPAERRIDMIAKTTPLEAAAAIARCAFYVGNDSGLTHAAAAVGTTTLGLFGPGYPALYRPWGERAAYVATPESAETLLAHAENEDGKEEGTLMTSLTVTAAYAAAVKLFDRTRPKAD